MNKYELEFDDLSIQQNQAICCQDAVYLDQNTLVCLFEHNLLQVFKFMQQQDDNQGMNQIHSMVLQGSENVPDSASICILKEQRCIILASHYG